MTRREEIERKGKIRADQYSHPVEWNDCYHHWIEGAEWADEHPDKNNVYTKQELREMGFGFTLNGDIVTPKEEEEMIKKYIEYKQKQLIEKACEWLERGGYFVNNTETMEDFRKAMKE